jgi:2-polyprenyl-6-methoxyphenol hydroxylase-like FAD-dependent oxidoreductase
MSNARPVEILGGGLAGLGLALGLRQAQIPVTLHEAGDYPRHRVCGEFITSLDADTIDRLALKPHLADALPATSVAWFRGQKIAHQHQLPSPAICLSRHALDQRLASALVAAGGVLRANSRQPLHPAEGRIVTAGRRPDASAPWIGLKVHLSNLPLAHDLELHLGRRAYVGLTQIENDRVNLCGLFHRGNIARAPRGSVDVLTSHLQAAGLPHLAQRIDHATLHEDSRCAVAGLDYRHAPPIENQGSLGDHSALIPPFTGHGMTIALQSARLALDPLIAWSKYQQDWPETLRQIDQRLRSSLRPKVRRAIWLHRWLLQPARQRILLALTRAHLLPTQTVYKLLH